MIEARAVVLRVEGGRAWVKVSDRQEGCGRCDEPGGCRSVKIAYAIKAPKDVFSLPNTLGVTVGEEVTVRMQDGAALRGALASYGLGVLLLLAGAAVGHFLAPQGQSDFFALTGALAGLVAAFLINRVLHASRYWRGSLRIEMIRPEGGCSLDSVRCP